ncbi:MAG: acylphosphatase [Desulfobacterales bacterium]
MNQKNEKVRAHVIVTGRVQGVFFRANTAQAAERCGVSGWVRNRRDGTVEAIFEGESGAVADVLDWCKKGDPPAAVKDVHVKWEDYSGEYVGFSIAY